MIARGHARHDLIAVYLLRNLVGLTPVKLMLRGVVPILPADFRNLFVVVSVSALALLIPYSRYFVHAWYVTHFTCVIGIQPIVIFE